MSDKKERKSIMKFLYVDWVLNPSDINNYKKVCLEVVDNVITRVLIEEEKEGLDDDALLFKELPMKKINSGYYVVNYKRYIIPVHTLYGLYVYGLNRDEYPEPFRKYQIDHIDRQRDNLNIKNMRLVPISENMKNRDPQRHDYKIIESEKDIIDAEFLPIIISYVDCVGEHYLTVYKHDGTFYKISGYRYSDDKITTIYKEIPYRHDRDTTPGNRTYLIRYGNKTHEYKEGILNMYGENVEMIYGRDEIGIIN